MSYDVGERDFEARVLARSREVPVVVDFWAQWCGPCRALGPALEAAVAKRTGEVELAKVDVDSNQMLAARFGVRGIPAVKAFRDGRVAAEFTGAIPPAQIERFLDELLPSPADRLAESGDEESLRRALALDPAHVDAGRRLGRLLLEREELDEAIALLDRFPSDFVAAGLAARARLAQAAGQPAQLERAFAAWDADRHDEALEALQEAIAADPGADRRDLLRRVMVAILTELGPADPLARSHRRRLAAALA